jgi:hypothetical protein
MPKIKAVRSFVWRDQGGSVLDVDVGDILDVTALEATRLVHAYEQCIPVDAVAPPASVMTTHGDPVVQHADPPVKRRR